MTSPKIRAEEHQRSDKEKGRTIYTPRADLWEQEQNKTQVKVNNTGEKNEVKLTQENKHSKWNNQSAVSKESRQETRVGSKTATM